MSSGRWPRVHRVAVLLAVVPVLLATSGCGGDDEAAGVAAATPSGPSTPEELEPLVVDELPSRLPRLPDEDIEPPAGAKQLEDVADYSDDPRRERSVLEDYGYRHGWERFWGSGSRDGPLTGVFVDQFEGPEGATAYAEDLARNEAEHYGGMLSEGSPDLPDGCHRLVVDDARPEEGLWGPTAFVWCPRGPFSVSVSAVAGSLDAATAEVRAVVVDQLDRLPVR